MGLFDHPGCSKNIDDRLCYAHGSFRLWALAHGKSPGLQSFSKAFFSMKSYADSPWSNSKGSDTTMQNQRLHWVASLHSVSPTAESQPYERLLRSFKHTAEQSFAFLGNIKKTHDTRVCIYIHT
jgi:hypothetical protein